MLSFSYQFWRALVIVASLSLWQSATAGPLPLLDAESRAEWQAIGRVNAAGYRVQRGCSGTLIAPDLVLTAAHCVTNAKNIGRVRHFVAGWFQGDYAAHRASRDFLVHPQYLAAKGAARLAYDVALIRLARPIPRTQVKPVDLIPPARLPEASALLMGYPQNRSHALSGQADCPLMPASTPTVLLYGCEVISGTSGGAVVEPFNGEKRLSAVIVARGGPSGHAIATPIDWWVYNAWTDALEREKSWP